ncbi:MAG: hypothetical protein JWP02_2403 [Acidimicrobiales bacterium]|nr:hypothetical protein [Acidimicrobiales bacterium]
MRTRLISLCVLFVLGLAACGGGKSSTSTDDTSATSTAPSTAASPATDTDLAKKLVFVQGDFPPGWTGKPADQTQTPDDKATSKELSDCVGTSGEAQQSARWKGDDFSMGQTQVGSEATVVKDEATYRKDVEAIKGSKLQTCVKDTFDKELTKQLGSAPTSLDVTPLDVPKHGDLTTALRMKVGASVQGVSLDLYLDVVLMGKRRAETTATFLNLGQPFDPALQKTLVDKLGARVDAV